MNLRWARVKGGYILHRKVQGESKALCGHGPGKADNTWRMRDRTGWATYIEGYEPYSDDSRCKVCMKKEAELLATT